MGLTFEQETLDAILAEQRRTNELLEIIADALSPSDDMEREPTVREKQKCPSCKAAFSRERGSAEPCQRCGAAIPSSK
jgi:hypothetical protein